MKKSLSKSSPRGPQAFSWSKRENFIAISVQPQCDGSGHYGQLPLAVIEVQESLRINRERWKRNPSDSPDDLARSLLIATMTEADPPKKCELAAEVIKIAREPQLRDAAKEDAEACKQR
jgi:hypothetical protein